ncbi:MAG: site-specific DNA-methyltransferase [Candidatus Pedobacter colombiensis]|uniref:Methyltransferase n=1 Tax=Candidatus Pedobacter colombiensis TaxID=3121371 RepID=A0AAJ5W6I4_9SPHI|nr:site-specific DNA-methyltransferase [Pedobacter sp.]WEK17894.1 MAG: site-specific DNA-methyltransferase [Pedobacter sp.]
MMEINRKGDRKTELWDRIIEGDCLEVMERIEDASVDLILCDLPYGVTNNRWDTIIDMKRLWGHYKRVIKPRGVIALTGQHAFTARLIMSNLAWFKYKIVWIKSKAGNFLNANKQPLRRHEDICIFYNKQPLYQPQKTEGIPYDKGIRQDNASGSYGNFKEFPVKNTDGKRYPTDVLCFEEEDIADWVYTSVASDTDGVYHPTQKPVSLGRWLIRTFTCPGGLVLDNACGSGSFPVAAILEGRHFIGIEKNDRSFHMGKRVDYIAICLKRIKDAWMQVKQADLFNNEPF